MLLEKENTVFCIKDVKPGILNPEIIKSTWGTSKKDTDAWALLQNN